MPGVATNICNFVTFTADLSSWFNMLKYICMCPLKLIKLTESRGTILDLDVHFWVCSVNMHVHNIMKGPNQLSKKYCAICDDSKVNQVSITIDIDILLYTSISLILESISKLSEIQVST